MVRRVLVECCDLNLCWVGLEFKTGVLVASTRRSRTSEIFDRRNIVRWETTILWSLPGFRIEMMAAIFHIVGMALVFSERLKISVRAEKAVGPRWFKWA